jgi:hypothetical protein
MLFIVLTPSEVADSNVTHDGRAFHSPAARVAGLFALTANLSASSHHLAPSIATPLNDGAASLAPTLPAPFSTPLIAVTTTIGINANAATANLK